MKRQPKKRKPRAVVAALPGAGQPVVLLDGRSYPARNVSEGGLAVWVPSAETHPFEAGRRLTVELRLGTESFPVEVEVRHHDAPRVAGLRFVQVPERLRRLLGELLEPGNFAEDIALVRGPDDEDPRNGFLRAVYASPAGAEVTVWYQPGVRMIVALQVVWGTTWVYRDQFKSPVAASLRPQARRTPGEPPAPEAFTQAPRAAEATELEKTSQFLSALPGPIPGNLLWLFLQSGEQVYLPESFAAPTRAA